MNNRKYRFQTEDLFTQAELRGLQGHISKTNLTAALSIATAYCTYAYEAGYTGYVLEPFSEHETYENMAELVPSYSLPTVLATVQSCALRQYKEGRADAIASEPQNFHPEY